MTLAAKRLLAIVCIVAMLAGTMLPSAAASKLPQTISIQPFGTKTYGDAPFKVVVTPDKNSGLADFIYISSDTDVADISDDGIITIKAAGQTDIIVMQSGNEEYKATASTRRLIVDKAKVSINELDLDNKTAVLNGVLSEDAGKVELDFDKVMLEEVYESLGYIKIRGVLRETPYTEIGYTKDIDTTEEEKVTISVVDDYDTDNKTFHNRATNEFLVNGTNAADYLGYSVIAYLRETPREQFEIVSIEPDPVRNQILTIRTDQFVGYSGSDYIVYLKDGATTATKIKIEEGTWFYDDGYEYYVPGMEIVYNLDGGMWDYRLDDLINQLYGGTITFIDNDDIKGYNVAIVEQTATAVVDEAIDGYVAFKDSVCLAVGGDIDGFYIDETDETKVIKILKDGKEINYTELKEWDVLSVIAANYDSDVIVAEVITNQMIGIIKATKKSKTSADGIAYYINDVWYDVVATCSGDVLKIGLGGTFYLDKTGKIAAFNEDTALAGGAESKYGYILGLAVDDDNLFGSAVVKIQMLTDDGVQVFELNNNAKLDDVIIYTTGVVCTDTDSDGDIDTNDMHGHNCAYDAVANIPANTIVKYTQNTSGNIISIKTAGYGGANADFTGFMSTVAGAEFEAENSKLDGAGYLDADVKVFAIDCYDAKNSKVLTIDAFEDKNDYIVLGMFATDKANDYDMVVVDAAAFKVAGATTNIAVITGVSEISNDDGEEVLGVNYYINGEEVEGLTDADTAAAVAYNLTVGDIVKLKATNGVITSIKFVANFTENIRTTSGIMDTVASGNYTSAADERFAAGVAAAYKISSSQIYLHNFDGYDYYNNLFTDGTFKLLDDANKYIIDFTAAGDITIGTSGSYTYFQNVYENARPDDTFIVKKNGTVINAASTDDVIAYTDYVVVREYDGRVTDYVIIKGADSITSIYGDDEDEPEIEEPVDENAEYGYILGTAVDDTAAFGSAVAKVQMLTDDGVQVFEVGDNAKLDDYIIYTAGVVCTDTDTDGDIDTNDIHGHNCAYDAIADIPTGTIVKYEKNADNKLIALTTAGYNRSFDGSMFGGYYSAEFEAENGKLDGAGYIDSNVKVFAIDLNDAKNSKILTIDAFEDQNVYQVFGMFSTNKAMDNDMVVVALNGFMAAGATSSIAVITEVAETLNDNYEEVLWLTYLKDGQEYSYLTDADTAIAVAGSITIGDVVKLKVMDNVITSISFVADFDDDIRMWSGTMGAVVAGNYAMAADEKFGMGIATAYKKSSSQITLADADSTGTLFAGATFKLLDDANKYVIDFTVAGDVVVGTTGSYKYFQNIYEDAYGGETFTVKKNNCVIDSSATAAEAIQYTDYVVVREYDGRVTDYVIIKGADAIIRNGYAYEYSLDEAALVQESTDTTASGLAVITGVSEISDDEGEEVIFPEDILNNADSELVIDEELLNAKAEAGDAFMQKLAIQQLLAASSFESFFEAFIENTTALGCDDIIAGYTDTDIQSIGQVLYNIRLDELDENSSYDDWFNGVKTAVVIVDLNNGYTTNVFDKLDAFEIIKNSGEKIAEFYGFVTDNIKAWTTQQISFRNISTRREFFDIFTEACVCGLVSEAPYLDVVRDVLLAFENEIGIRINSMTNRILDMLIGRRYDSYAALKMAYHDAIEYSNSGAGSVGGGTGGGGTNVSAPVTKVSAYNLCLKGEKAANYELAETKIDNLTVCENNIAEVKVYLTGEVNEFRGNGNGNYLIGSTLTVGVTPTEGRVLEGWYIDGEKVSTALDYTFCVEKDTEIYVYFAEDLTVSTETVYTEENGKWKFNTNITNCPENAELVIALYESGRMIDFKATKDFTDGYAELYLEKNNFDKAKVMLWDAFGSLKPLAEVKEVLFK